MARGQSSFRSHSHVMMLEYILQAQIKSVIDVHSAVLRLQAHSLHQLALFEGTITRTRALFSKTNHIIKLTRRYSLKMSLLIHSRTNPQKMWIFRIFQRIRGSLMGDEVRNNLNCNVAQDSPAAFSREELDLYVLDWLQMRPLNLHRHQIQVVADPLRLVHGCWFPSWAFLCRTWWVKIRPSPSCDRLSCHDSMLVFTTTLF